MNSGGTCTPQMYVCMYVCMYMYVLFRCPQLLSLNPFEIILIKDEVMQTTHQVQDVKTSKSKHKSRFNSMNTSHRFS